MSAGTAAAEDDDPRAAAWDSLVSKVSAFGSAALSAPDLLPGAAASRADPYATLDRYRAEVARRLPAEYAGDGGGAAAGDAASTVRTGRSRRAAPAEKARMLQQRSAQLQHERVNEDFVRTRAMARFESRTKGGFG